MAWVKELRYSRQLLDSQDFELAIARLRSDGTAWFVSVKQGSEFDNREYIESRFDDYKVQPIALPVVGMDFSGNVTVTQAIPPAMSDSDFAALVAQRVRECGGKFITREFHEQTA